VFDHPTSELDVSGSIKVLYISLVYSFIFSIPSLSPLVVMRPVMMMRRRRRRMT